MSREWDYSNINVDSDKSLDFDNLYRIGRVIKGLSQSESKLEYIDGGFVVFNGQINEEFVKIKGFERGVLKLREILDVITQVLKGDQFVVKPSFVELSIFDPEDTTCTSFYSVLFGKASVIETYLREMNQNIAIEGIEDEDSRGALLPSPSFYNAAHYSKIYDNEDRMKCESWDDSDVSVYVAAYNVPPEASKNLGKDDSNKIRQQINAFFDVVMEDVLHDSNGESEANLALLVPITRPVGAVTDEIKEQKEKLRGGGLFVFGKIERGPSEFEEKVYKPERTAIRLLSILNRAVMVVSQTRVETAKALDYLHEHAYDAQGHELKKLIPWIMPKTPEIVFANIRMYFYTLFAVSEKDVDKIQQSENQWVYPKEYAKGDTLEDFIINAMRVAMRVEAMIAWCRRQDLNDWKPQPDNEVSEIIEAEVDEKIKLLRFVKSERFFSIFISEDFKSRWYFFGALVAAFRNILHHAQGDKEITLTREGDRLAIYNQGQGSYSSAMGKTVRGKEKPWRGSTGSTIEFFVKKYNNDPKQVEMKWEDANEDSENLTFLTILPLPKNFLRSLYEENLHD